MRTFVLLALCFAAVTAVPTNQQRIVGGSEVTIDQYPSLVALLYARDLVSFSQSCAGTILNNRSILTTTSCVQGDTVGSWRFRVGSSYANSGGTVYNIIHHITHPGYSAWTQNNDIAVLRSATTIVYVNNAVQPGTIANAGYWVADNQVVWAAGWGATSQGGPSSEQLRHVQLLTVNQGTCSQRYSELRRTITGTMLCAGSLDAGGRDQCLGDNGGPLYQSNVVVGVYSWGEGCGQGRYPGVNTRVPIFTGWIQANA